MMRCSPRVIIAISVPFMKTARVASLLSTRAIAFRPDRFLVRIRGTASANLSSSSELFRSLRSKHLGEELLRLEVDVPSVELAVRYVEAGAEWSEDGNSAKEAADFHGPSAIKAYRTYMKRVAPPEGTNRDSTGANDLDDSILRDIRKTAATTAGQILFLGKRHRSHICEWVRHTDGEGRDRTTFPLTLVLDNLRSAHNVGSLFRTADACGVSEIITAGITPRPGGPGALKLAKAALGADRTVPSRHFSSTAAALRTLRDEGHVRIIGMETTARSVSYTGETLGALSPGGPTRPLYEREGAGTALILGNEVTGVDTEVMAGLDALVEVPMYGIKNSLNVAAAAPIVLYEILRQWKVH